tara:strand:+ start:477 stop:1529 length:1053 start_codon:yes stop_codon:yes gene_type:complete
MVNVNFNKERSLELSPPDYPKGVRWIKRIIIKRDSNDWSVRYQPKAGIYDKKNVAKLRLSYGEHGFLYDEPVQVVTPSTTSDKEFEGIGGFQRNSAQELLEWEFTIVDVVEFDSALERRIFAFETNHIFAPRVGNTKIDIIYGVKEAIKADPFELDQTDDNAVKSFINRAAADLSESERNSIFKTVRKEFGKFANLKPLDGSLANKLAKNLGLQFAGVKNKDADGIAYVKEHGDSKTLYYDGLKMSLKHFGKNVTVYGYVADPTPNKLAGDRAEWLEKFNNLVDFHYLVVSQASGDDIATTRLSAWCPFVFGGFLPQDITPIGSDNTPKEAGLVDENGRAFNVVDLKKVA